MALCAMVMHPSRLMPSEQRAEILKARRQAAAKSKKQASPRGTEEGSDDGESDDGHSTREASGSAPPAPPRRRAAAVAATAAMAASQGKVDPLPRDNYAAMQVMSEAGSHTAFAAAQKAAQGLARKIFKHAAQVSSCQWGDCLALLWDEGDILDPGDDIQLPLALLK